MMNSIFNAPKNKITKFDGNNFKSWKQEILNVLMKNLM